MPKIVSYSKNNKEIYAISFKSKNLSIFTQLYQLFYLNKIKIIPYTFYDLITPVSLAYWIMSDGSIAKNELILCIYSCFIPDVVQLINVLIIKF